MVYHLCVSCTGDIVWVQQGNICTTSPRCIGDEEVAEYPDEDEEVAEYADEEVAEYPDEEEEFGGFDQSEFELSMKKIE